MPYAFRCKNCGHLEPASHAGENAVPHACSVCGCGVEFNRAGIKTLQPENWEVLADAGADRHAELGLEVGQVERHAPATVTKADGQSINRSVSELASSHDKA